MLSDNFFYPGSVSEEKAPFNILPCKSACQTITDSAFNVLVVWFGDGVVGYYVWFTAVSEAFTNHEEQVWLYPKKHVSFSPNSVVNQKPSFRSVLRPSENLRPNVDFYVQAALIPLPLRLCWTKRGSHANAEAGRKQKERKARKGGKLIEDSEVERMECERRRKKMSSESIKA